MGGPVRGRLLIWGDAMCLRARIRSFKPPQLHFLPFYHNLEVDKDCLVTQFCLFCIVTSLKILASYTLLPLLMYSCKFQLRNSIFIILYTITCALNDQSCRCAIKQHSFIHSFIFHRKAFHLVLNTNHHHKIAILYLCMVLNIILHHPFPLD